MKVRELMALIESDGKFALRVVTGNFTIQPNQVRLPLLVSLGPTCHRALSIVCSNKPS